MLIRSGVIPAEKVDELTGLSPANFLTLVLARAVIR